MRSIKHAFPFSMVGVVSCGVLMGLIGLSGCESITGKSIGLTTSDAVISSTVQTKLKNDDHLAFLPPIDVDTERGVVNLSGVVPTDFQRAEATRLAQEVEGVTRVNNKLRVRPWLF
jgi:osmotically-inducible protein OsmY